MRRDDGLIILRHSQVRNLVVDCETRIRQTKPAEGIGNDGTILRWTRPGCELVHTRTKTLISDILCFRTVGIEIRVAARVATG